MQICILIPSLLVSELYAWAPWSTGFRAWGLALDWDMPAPGKQITLECRNLSYNRETYAYLAAQAYGGLLTFTRANKLLPKAI